MNSFSTLVLLSDRSLSGQTRSAIGWDSGPCLTLRDVATLSLGSCESSVLELPTGSRTVLLHHVLGMLPKCRRVVHDSETLAALGWQWLPGLAESLGILVEELT